MKVEFGDTIIKAILFKEFESLINFINVGKTMNNHQIAETITLIQQYFPHITLADLKLFLNRLKMGQYGTFYDRIDGQIIIEKLESYNKERMNVVEDINLEIHKKIKKEETLNMATFHPSVIEEIKKVVDQAKAKNKNSFVNFNPPQRTNNQNIMQRWMKQFDNLYFKFGVSISGKRFLSLNNKKLSLEEFLEQKIINQKR